MHTVCELLLMLLALALATPARAQEYDAETFKAAVLTCIAEVRAAGERRDRMGRVVGQSRFDAFVNGPGYVTLIGTEQERYQFKRCMAAQGVPLRGE